LRTIDSGFTDALRGLAVDPRGALYAAGDYAIRRFNRAGALSHTWATTRRALSVAVAPAGPVFVGEPGQIEIFSETGQPLGAWRDDKLFGSVTSIGFAGKDVLVGDCHGRGIHRLDRTGKRINSIGTDNPVNGFLVCNGVLDFSVDASGAIHAANPGKHRVERYACSGELLGTMGRFNAVAPQGFGGCCNPTNVSVRDYVYVTEKAPPRAKVYDFTGNLLAVIADGVFHPLCRNMSIDVDAEGRVYVSDTVKLTIHVFEPEVAHAG
jgi:sugar lactone lactonase YvrE